MFISLQLLEDILLCKCSILSLKIHYYFLIYDCMPKIQHRLLINRIGITYYSTPKFHLTPILLENIVLPLACMTWTSLKISIN